MKGLLLSTFLVGSSLLFGDLYASNNVNEEDPINDSQTRARRPNTFKSIIQKKSVVSLAEHEELLSELREIQKNYKSLEEEYTAFKLETSSNEEKLLELESMKALSFSASSKSKFLQKFANPFLLTFERDITSFVKKARLDGGLGFERMDEEINAMLIYALLRPEEFFPSLMNPLLKSLGNQNDVMRVFATFIEGGYTLVDESPFSDSFHTYTKEIGLNSGRGIDPEEMGGRVEKKGHVTLCEKEESIYLDQENDGTGLLGKSLSYIRHPNLGIGRHFDLRLESDWKD